MKLNIRNFAKIKEAEIIIDGITVIAGENNTGKSTVGKILFSLFNALSRVNEKVSEECLKEIERTSREVILSHIIDKGNRRYASYYSRFLDIAKNTGREQKKELYAKKNLLGEAFVKEIEEKIESEIKLVEGIIDCSVENLRKEIYDNILEILNLPEEKIVSEILSRYFNEVFYSQISSLEGEENIETTLELEIKGKKERLIFKNNTCKEFWSGVKILHNAIYIDNPFIIDELSKDSNRNPMERQLIDLLTSKPQNGVLDGIIGAVRAKEKLKDVYEKLQNVVDGEVLSNQNNGEYYLKNNDFHEPISFHNLSTGIKSFMILKMLLEKGCLKEKDVVVLDEPEIHLHPQWQIAYAELIVLLQKYFDLSVVVTTHSPYFVDAINLFSVKHGTDSKVNYYLSRNWGNTVTMDCVTKEIDQIYKKMASPIEALDNLRYELNNH